MTTLRPHVAARWLRLLRQSFERYQVVASIDVPSEIRDPKDEPVVALAVATTALIVTGDKDFLDHKGDLGVTVLGLSEALELL